MPSGSSSTPLDRSVRFYRNTLRRETPASCAGECTGVFIAANNHPARNEESMQPQWAAHNLIAGNTLFAAPG
jgi:hypothetical protein